MGLTLEDKVARHGKVTGSRIARIVGKSPYGGPLSVFLEMNAPPDAPEEHREEFDRGNFLEPGVLAWHAHKAGCVIRPVATLFHPKHERCAVTLDGIATYPHEERAAEAKTVHWKKASEWGEEGTDQIPKHYLIQANWGAGVAGLKRTDVPALIGLELRQYLVNFDAELFEMLLEQAERFLRDHIDTGKAPEVDGSEAANEWLDKRFEERELKLVADAEAEALMATLQEYRREMKSLEVCEDLAIQKLQEILGRNGADAMVGSDWSLTWRRPKGRLVLDTDALLAELNAPEELIQKHSRISEPKRAFKPRWRGEK